MNCPDCNSESVEVLKSKGKKSRELLLKCGDCGRVFKEFVPSEVLHDYRVVVSEFEKTHKSYVKLKDDASLKVGDVLYVESRPVEITSLENKRGARIRESLVTDLETIWASYIDIPSRVGVSIDYHGRVSSYKVEVPPDLEFRVDDIVKLGKVYFRINSLKTLERKLRRGFARASVTKRVYGRPVENHRYNIDLTSKVVLGFEE